MDGSAEALVAGAASTDPLLQRLLFFVAVWASLFGLFYVTLGRWLRPGGSSKDASMRWLITGRFNSLLHGALMSVLAAHQLLLGAASREPIDAPITEEQSLILEVSLAYFLVDSVPLVLVEGDTLFILHHAAMLVLWSSALFAERRMAIFAMLHLLFGEITNPLQSTLWLAERTGAVRIKQAILPIFTFAFLLCRVVFLPAVSAHMSWYLFTQPHSAGPFWPPVWAVLSSSAMVGSWVWAWMLWRKYQRHCSRRAPGAVANNHAKSD